MLFEIRFLPRASHDLEGARYGVIQIEGFQERFLSSLEYWREDDYERQWEEGIRRIAAGENVSCLITSIRDPARHPSVAWWTLYRIHDVVHVQNAILFIRLLREPFDLSNPYRAIPRRRMISPDGPLSEWTLLAEEFSAWLRMNIEDSRAVRPRGEPA